MKQVVQFFNGLKRRLEDGEREIVERTGLFLFLTTYPILGLLAFLFGPHEKNGEPFSLSERLFLSLAMPFGLWISAIILFFIYHILSSVVCGIYKFTMNFIKDTIEVGKRNDH